MIEMALWFLDSIGVKGRLLLNSVGCGNCRPAYIEKLRQALQNDISHFCEDCRRRATTNSLRVLDCKVESCQPYIEKLPVITDHLCEECSRHFAHVREYLVDAGIPFQIVPRLVRGLDYYVRTAFEIVSGDLGAQNALAGGGRYDGLAEVLGGPPAKGIGFAMGLDRLVMVMPAEQASGAQWRPELYLAYLGEAAFKRALEIARILRHNGHSCYVEFSQGSLKSQMRQANKLMAEHVLIIGDSELANDRYAIKCLQESRQWEVTVPELIDYLDACRQRSKASAPPNALPPE
jgi:histidyl-tRNA synthetase